MTNIHSNPTPLRQKFIEYLTLNRKAERTVHCYVSFIYSLAKHYRRSPDLLGPGGHSPLALLPDCRAQASRFHHQSGHQRGAFFLRGPAPARHRAAPAPDQASPPPRVGQSGALTGQQYSVGKECAVSAKEERRKATITRAKMPQSHRLTKTHPSQMPQPQAKSSANRLANAD